MGGALAWTTAPNQRFLGPMTCHIGFVREARDSVWIRPHTLQSVFNLASRKGSGSRHLICAFETVVSLLIP